MSVQQSISEIDDLLNTLTAFKADVLSPDRGRGLTSTPLSAYSPSPSISTPPPSSSSFTLSSPSSFTLSSPAPVSSSFSLPPPVVEAPPPVSVPSISVETQPAPSFTLSPPPSTSSLASQQLKPNPALESPLLSPNSFASPNSSSSNYSLPSYSTFKKGENASFQPESPVFDSPDDEYDALIASLETMSDNVFKKATMRGVSMYGIQPPVAIPASPTPFTLPPAPVQNESIKALASVYNTQSAPALMTPPPQPQPQPNVAPVVMEVTTTTTVVAQPIQIQKTATPASSYTEPAKPVQVAQVQPVQVAKVQQAPIAQVSQVQTVKPVQTAQVSQVQTAKPVQVAQVHPVQVAQVSQVQTVKPVQVAQVQTAQVSQVQTAKPVQVAQVHPVQVAQVSQVQTAKPVQVTSPPVPSVAPKTAVVASQSFTASQVAAAEIPPPLVTSPSAGTNAASKPFNATPFTDVNFNMKPNNVAVASHHQGSAARPVAPGSSVSARSMSMSGPQVATVTSFNPVGGPKVTSPPASSVTSPVKSTDSARHINRSNSVASSLDSPLPKGWKEYVSNTTGKKYYYNTVTKTPQWDRPTEPATATPPSSPTLKSSSSVSNGSRRTLTKTAQSEVNLYDPKRKGFTLKSPSSNMLQKTVQIELVDGSASKKLNITDDFTVKDLIVSFAEKLDLWQIEYFQLCAENADGTGRWLGLSKTIVEERITPQTKLVLKVKHWKEPKKLIDPQAVSIFYIQLKRYVTGGYYPVFEKLALQLAAYQLVETYGKYDASKHIPGFFDKSSILSFISATVLENGGSLEAIEKRLLQSFSEASKNPLSKLEAQLKYIELAGTIPLFGLSLFTVREDGSERKLGIAENGFHLTKKNQKYLFDFYHFEEIASWSQTAAGLEIKISNPDKKPLFQFVTTEGGTIAELLSEYYTLLSNQMPENKQLNCVALPEIKAEDLPEVKIYEIPKKEQKVLDVFGSRLEYFKMSYIDKTANNTLIDVMNQIHNALDSDTTLSSLQLMGLELSDASLEPLTLALNEAMIYKAKETKFKEDLKIVDLNLKNVKVSGANFGKLVQFIESTVTVEKLDISGLSLGVKGAQDFQSFLERNRSITNLIAANNSLETRGTTILMNAISKLPNFQYLDISRNGLDSQIVEPICKFVVQHESFKGISVGYNKLKDEHTVALTQALNRKRDKAIKQVDFSGTGCSNATLKELTQFIQANPQFESLSLADIELGAKFVAHLGTAVLNTNIHYIRYINFSNCKIPSKALKEFFKGFNGNRKLESLNLSGNTIKKKSGAMLAQFLSNASQMKSLILIECELVKSVLLAILEAAKGHNGLEQLDLSSNPDLSSSDVVREIESVFIHNKKLNEFNIARGDISPNGMISIISSLSSTNISRINIAGNKAGKSLKKLGEILNSNPKISALNLKKCDLKEKEVLPFLSGLNVAKCKIRYINFQENELDPKSMIDALKNIPNVKVVF
eukprot:TRINITY_DN4578_c0_g1_i3.p1 TRINITY_DN4578_c0_g1~~TRINITY_DN4578_c0_g1_i3.p1  ORF type:complete len:1470 (-),score=651.05 TRINITY_DN4578_c0_g1_i3:52-4461(-)